jgi:hypothetical protein
MSQPSRAGLKFGYRPYGPRSDSRSIFELRHGLGGLGHRTAIRLTPYGDISLQQNCHPDRSGPGFPTSRNQQQPRMRLLVQEAA